MGPQPSLDDPAPAPSRRPAEISAAVCAEVSAKDPQSSAGRPLHVPVRPGRAGSAVRLFRTPLGGRTAVAFTSRARLSAALGTGQPSVVLAESALRALAAPLGVTALTVDPTLTARPTDTPPAAGAAAPAGRRLAATGV